MGDLSGRVCVVTGASAGIGTETAVGLARLDATLHLVGRDSTRLAKAAERCRAAGAADVQAHRVDFAELAQVRQLADTLLQHCPRLHLLVDNAGLAMPSRQLTVDGYETTFAVNHLAPYLLTRLLQPRLVESAPARVVVVASDAYTFGPIDLTDLQSSKGYAALKVYGKSKLANMLFTHELARRLAGRGVTANCVHPGFVATRLGRQSRLASLGLKLISPFIASPAKGARSSLYAATSDEGGSVSGRYFVGREVRPTEPAATDDDTARQLWDLSADLVGLPR